MIKYLWMTHHRGAGPLAPKIPTFIFVLWNIATVHQGAPYVKLTQCLARLPLVRRLPHLERPASRLWRTTQSEASNADDVANLASLDEPMDVDNHVERKNMTEAQKSKIQSRKGLAKAQLRAFDMEGSLSIKIAFIAQFSLKILIFVAFCFLLKIQWRAEHSKCAGRLKAWRLDSDKCAAFHHPACLDRFLSICALLFCLVNGSLESAAAVSSAHHEALRVCWQIWRQHQCYFG